MAANKGHAKAQFNLAISYYDGEGVQQDVSKAIYWLEKAAAQGHEKSQNFLPKARERLREMRRQARVCQHCGGTFTGFLTKKCSNCGRPKDY